MVTGYAIVLALLIPIFVLWVVSHIFRSLFILSFGRVLVTVHQKRGRPYCFG